jgi:hypothetical protein
MIRGLHADSKSQILESNPFTLLGQDDVRIANVDLQNVATQPRRSWTHERPAEYRFDVPT